LLVAKLFFLLYFFNLQLYVAPVLLMGATKRRLKFTINIKRSFSEKIGEFYLFKGFEIVALGKFCSK